jgi:glycosyltransferase involved in cell wall biosynthesis
MDDIKLTYYGHVFDASGYGQAARAYIHALHSAGVSLSVVDLMNHGRQVEDDLVNSLLGKHHDADFHLFHGIPPQWARLAFRMRNAIGMTVWETDTMPPQWRNVLSQVVDVWLPSTFNVETFQPALPTSVFRLPHPVVPRHVNGDAVDPASLTSASPSDFVFYSLFEWQDRKGPCELIRAYFRAFPVDNGTLLALKTNPGAASISESTVDQIRRETGSTARVSVMAHGWSEAQVDALHARGDCYVSLHRGEGWGYPLFEAVARGKPVVATGFSGPLDYLSASAARLVRFDLAPVRQRYVYYAPQMQWAEPDVDDAARLMQEAYAERGAPLERTAACAASVCETYSLERVGQMARERLLTLLRGHNRRRWRAIRLSTIGGSLVPPVPIPGEWYDEDYFENGLKSNWADGYGWDAFAGVFRGAASYLIEMFPEATSFLDAGCGKGFLVRSLREEGKASWGFDHSAWAIDHADPTARPFLRHAGVDDVEFDRNYDVLVALDLFSHLTEEQSREFLRRARDRTTMAIVAAIPSFETDEEERRHGERSDDQDRSHVTIRQRPWWDALFKETGWRLDAVQRLGADVCRRHPFPQRMGWRVYVYAP